MCLCECVYSAASPHSLQFVHLLFINGCDVETQREQTLFSIILELKQNFATAFMHKRSVTGQEEEREGERERESETHKLQVLD